jgi:hypothetical protein
MMKTIYIAGYRGKGAGGRAIKWFTFSPYSHVSMVFDMGDHGLEYESIQRKGVHKQIFDPAADCDLYPLKVYADEEMDAIRAWESILGAKYDWTGIWGFLVRKKRELLSRWFCSEAASWVCRTIGKRLSRKKDFQHTPGDVCASMVLGDPVAVPARWECEG